MIRIRAVIFYSLMFTIFEALSSEEVADDSVHPLFNSENNEGVTLSIANLVCYSYGKYTNEPDAPIYHDEHSDVANQLLMIALRQSTKDLMKKIKNKDVERYKAMNFDEEVRKKVTHIHSGIKDSLKKDYQKAGPEGLKIRLREVMTDPEYTYPKWIKNCDNLLSYSKSMLND